VVTGDQYATLKSLQLAAPHISKILTAHFRAPDDDPIPIPRPNTKWSKISINGVPTGVTDSRGPYNPTENHNSITANNPSYARLPITQRPSWVRPPTSYTEGTISSLSVAFEDPDGSLLQSLLAEKYLYVHGHRATICKWKQRQPSRKDNLKATTAAQTADSGSSDDKDDEDIEIQLTTQPTQVTSQPAGPSRQPRDNTAQAQTTQQTTSNPATATRRPNPPHNAKGKARKVT
jgi:hypothetical protein